MRTFASLIACGMLAALPHPGVAAPAAASAAREFQQMDSNKDGKVSPEEHAIGAQKMFIMMDKDKDGRVTAAEMDLAHHSMHGAKDQQAMHAADKIKAIDSNGDGILSAEEHRVGAAAMFGKMDSGKDGFLSMGEIAAGHASMLHKKPD